MPFGVARILLVQQAVAERVLPGEVRGDTEVPGHLAGDDRVLVLTQEPVRAAQILTTWALERDVDLGHFAVSQPTLEDIYLELTGAAEPTSQVQEVPA